MARISALRLRALASWGHRDLFDVGDRLIPLAVRGPINIIVIDRRVLSVIVILRLVLVGLLAVMLAVHGAALCVKRLLVGH